MNYSEYQEIANWCKKLLIYLCVN